MLGLKRFASIKSVQCELPNLGQSRLSSGKMIQATSSTKPCIKFPLKCSWAVLPWKNKADELEEYVPSSLARSNLSSIKNGAEELRGPIKYIILKQLGPPEKGKGVEKQTKTKTLS